ncbi:hypothetical protein [Aeromonas media]|uniref:hypothetical protein n=1 Tax=Aeromonas media TaxID=651 RepID=UPI00384A9E43
MKNADMPAAPVLNGDNEPADFDHSFYRNGNLATGLTKREMIAMHIMCGIAPARFTPEYGAEQAVSYADALLAELGKGGAS